MDMSNMDELNPPRIDHNGEMVLELFQKMDNSIGLDQATSTLQEVYHPIVELVGGLPEVNHEVYVVPQKNTAGEQVVKGTIANDKLLNIIHMLVHYRYMMNFLNRNILIGGVRSMLTTAVPNFKTDLRSVDAHFDNLIRSMPILSQITADMKQYHVDLDQQYVSYDGRVGKINWEKAKKKATLEHPKLKKTTSTATATVSSTETSTGDNGGEEKQGENNNTDQGVKRANNSNKQNPPTKRVKTHNKGTSTRPIPRPKILMDTNTLLKMPDYRCSYHGCRFRSNFSMQEVKLHEDRCHLNANSLNCPHLGCFNLFPNEQELQEHMDQYHARQVQDGPDEDNSVFACPLDWCSDTFPTAYKLKCHIRDLHSIQYESCSLCKKRFTKRHCLVVHVRKIHNGLSEAERKKLLLEPDEDQIKQQASKAKKEKSNKVVQRCMIERCDVIFENATKLLQHIKEMHPDFYTTCKYCGKFCKTRQHLNIHVYHFHREGEYACRERGCDFKAKLCMELKRHEKREHPKPILCNVDGCTDLVLPSDARAHNRENHPHLLEAVHECIWPECDKKFDDLSRLRRHLRMHTAFKRYRCRWEDCDYASEQKGTTVAHIRVCHLNLPRTQAEELQLNLEVHPSEDICQYIEIVNAEEPENQQSFIPEME